MDDADVVALLQILAAESGLVPGRLKVKASRDPADDEFLAAAVEGMTEYEVPVCLLRHQRRACGWR